MFGTKRDSQEWVSVGRECHSYAPIALLGWRPGIAVVRITFLKWVLMFFTAGKYAIMGIFPLQIPGPPWPPRLPPTLLTLFSLCLKPVYLITSTSSPRPSVLGMVDASTFINPWVVILPHFQIFQHPFCQYLFNKLFFHVRCTSLCLY